MEGFRFAKAKSLLEQSLTQKNSRFENTMLLARLRLMLQEDDARSFALQVIKNNKVNKRELQQQAKLFAELPAAAIAIDDRLDIAIKLCALDDVSQAEKLFKQLRQAISAEDTPQQEKMAILAGKLAFYYRQRNNDQAAKSYDAYSLNISAAASCAGS